MHELHGDSEWLARRSTFHFGDDARGDFGTGGSTRSEKIDLRKGGQEQSKVKQERGEGAIHGGLGFTRHGAWIYSNEQIVM
jgi:hypothetical protein